MSALYKNWVFYYNDLVLVRNGFYDCFNAHDLNIFS